MITWCLISPAWATDPWWSGAWGIDPVGSDDPLPLMDQSYRPPATSPSAARLAPDNAMDAAEESYEKTREETMRYLNRSGRISLDPTGDQAVNIGFDSVQVADLPLDGSWTKVASADDVGRFKVRAWESGEVLTVERRFKGLVLRETWLPPDDAAPEQRVVVVRLDGASLGSGVEFRRVYRRL